jgi:nitrite reductase/ring-hydroxylating ferredoxin subunit
MTGAGEARPSRRLRAYLGALIAGRRPRPFTATADEAAQVEVAIELRTARPGATTASEEFLSRLRHRLEREFADHAPSRGDAPSGGAGAARGDLLGRAASRRRVVITSAAAVAGVAAGATVDRLVVDDEVGPADDGVLHPNSGVWYTVATSAELPENGVRPFNVGPVVGFVQRTGGQLHAISGICSHQGCLLTLDDDDLELLCPCHNAAFGLTGRVLRYQLAVPPPALPAIAAREVDGQVQILAPP